MGVHKKGGLVGGFDQLRAPDAPTISVSGGDAQVTVTITNPSDTGGGDITGYAVSTLTGPIEDTTFAVTVVSDSGNKYAIDGTTQGTVTLHKGHTYIFDQSDSSNSSHPLRLSTTSNGSHGGGSEYTTGVTTSGTPGSAGAFTKIAVDSGAASTLYYYCSSHSGMGGSATVKTSLQGGASGSSSPVTVSSLTNGESYNVRASAINAFGQSPYSAATTGTPALIRGLFAGGYVSAVTDTIQYISINSTGNAQDFGNLSESKYGVAALASSTRAVFSGGSPDGGTQRNTMEYVTIATTGDVTDFGDLTVAKWIGTATSNATRGLNINGAIGTGTGRSDTINYITIASAGNATDFGDLVATTQEVGSTASSTRAVIGGGYPSSGNSNVIQYVTIASAGNASDFGDLNNATRQIANGTISSGTRGVFSGGQVSGAYGNQIDYITIASTGNATDFGDLLAGRNWAAACSSTTRGITGGGYTDSNNTNSIEYLTIASTGNGTDFGDLDSALWVFPGCSNVHGGLS